MNGWAVIVLMVFVVLATYRVSVSAYDRGAASVAKLNEDIVRLRAIEVGERWRLQAREATAQTNIYLALVQGLQVKLGRARARNRVHHRTVKGLNDAIRVSKEGMAAQILAAEGVGDRDVAAATRNCLVMLERHEKLQVAARA